MLLSGKGFEDFIVETKDNEIGTLKDMYFDDDKLTIRYLVVKTSGRIGENKFLVSPIMVERVDLLNRSIHLSIEDDTLKSCPTPDDKDRVSRTAEQRYYDFLGAPYYWAGTATWGVAETPAGILDHPYPLTHQPDQALDDIYEHEDDIHLRSFNEVQGYQVTASDGEVGEIQDILLEDENWRIRYFVVRTGTWLKHRDVLISPEWLEKISWGGKVVYFNATKEAIENSPLFDPDQPVNRHLETRLYDYYGRPRYWESQGEKPTP